MKKLFSLFAAAILLCSLTSCQQQQKKNTGNISTQADLKLSCVAEFIRSDGSRYLTEQKHEISSNPKAIILTANEPFGKVVWSVQNGQYAVQESTTGVVYDKELYGLMTDKAIAQGLLELYLAGLTANPAAQTGKELLTFEGKTYELSAQTGSRVNIYRNQATGKIDLVTSGDKADKLYLLHGFNYRKMKKIDGQYGFYPSRLDIYLYHTDSNKELIAQISCSLR